MNRDRKRAIYDVDSTADMVRLLYNVKKPVIAAINGPAFGAGIALAMACDILIASDRAQFGFSFTGLGFCPDSGTCWFLTQRVGYNKACAIMESLEDYGIVSLPPGDGPRTLLVKSVEEARQIILMTDSTSII